MGAGASVLCGGQRRLLVPVALIVSTSEPFHSHVGVRALENMERVFVPVPISIQAIPILLDIETGWMHKPLRANEKAIFHDRHAEA